MDSPRPCRVLTFWNAFGRATKVPLPWILKISPSFCRSPSAWRTVMRLTSKALPSSFSEGMRLSGG